MSYRTKLVLYYVGFAASIALASWAILAATR